MALAGSARSSRATLEELISLDVFGPLGGPEEKLTGRERVRDRYLVGMLAPKRTVGLDPERVDTPATEGDDASAEAEVEDRAAAISALFPSSYGITFAVTPETAQVRVEAHWGRYEKHDLAGEGAEEPSGYPSPGGAAARPEAKRVWQRYQVSGWIDIDLSHGPLAPVAPVPEQPDVVISGRVTATGRCRLVTLFLTNDQESPERNKDEAWLFQAGFAVSAPDGSAVFIGRREAVPDGGGFAEATDAFDEVTHLEMLYRDRVEFAVGHGVAVHAEVAPDNPGRAIRISTTALPVYEVPRVEAPTAEEEPDLAAAVLDMSELARTDDLRAALEPLATAYENWIDRQERRIDDPAARLADHRHAAVDAIADARETARRIRDGIELVAIDPDARDAFRFANEAMWHQRVRTAAALARLEDPEATIEQADAPGNRSWRPFQLAFVLLNLPGLTDPRHPDRTGDGLADLLFFPTGGGKTEAYLGLCAYTFAIRRLQGTVRGRSGEAGVAVLMRYTLRLLTAQQFQRASALVCACEVIRRRDEAKWGHTQFRIALWVGSSLTQNRSRDAQHAVQTVRATGRTRGAHPLQLSTCPWCGHHIDAARDVHYDNDTWRTLVYCRNDDCDFSERNADREGLPVVTVDEDMYRLLPALVIATADKFAQLPLKGETRMLFGHVGRRCTRHGYRSPDLDRAKDREEHDTHRATRKLPAARTEDCLPLRPPDLIIQDELHLISGPLGTLVGLYETAIDELCTQDGSRPKVVASTATVRRAREQVWGIFWRDLRVFPPPVLDAADSFFARERPVSEKPGRLYIGICAPGTRLKTVERRVFSTVLAAAQSLYEKHGSDADPWMTLVGYFGALRELGGMRRIVEDEVRSDLRRADRRGLARRTGLTVRELTSRVASSEIRQVLDELGNRFDPDAPEDAPKPIDVVLATNMISVGVDVPRLGLMVCVGQPKATAEYIQATSRVGRSDAGPGLVLTIYNWARPRDLSHYETFEHYHATFYRQVEALSVTPFAARALDRGLTAVAVSMLRHGVDEWNGNPGANAFDKAHARVAEVEEAIVRRAEGVGGAHADLVRTAVRERMDSWATKRRQVAESAALGYQPEASLAGLLETPTLGDWPLWAVPNSMRETEPIVNLIVDDRDESLRDAAPFRLGEGEPVEERDTAEDEEPGDDGR